MNAIIVFAHMMKTAGTAFNKQFIGHFGRKMHIVPGGLKMDHDYYDKDHFQSDLKKSNFHLQLIAGHPIRPYMDYGEYEKNMHWATILRKPAKRYVSHYFHDYKWSHNFAQKHYKNMKNSSIKEWEKLENYSNYQTKFIAGEENLDKAIEIIENKMKWVGLTEELENSFCSFKKEFGLKNFHYDLGVTNPNLALKKEKQQVADHYSDFIEEQNQIDQKLYAYVKENIWPRFKVDNLEGCNHDGGKLRRSLNTAMFQVNRQLKYKPTAINLKNLKRFYNRWYR